MFASRMSEVGISWKLSLNIFLAGGYFMTKARSGYYWLIGRGSG